MRPRAVLEVRSRRSTGPEERRVRASMVPRLARAHPGALVPVEDPVQLIGLGHAGCWTTIVSRVAIVGLLAIGPFCGLAWGAKLTDDQVRELITEQRKLRPDINEMKGSGVVSNAASFNRYYDIELQLFTAEQYANQLPKMRKQLKLDLNGMGNAGNPQAHGQLNALLLQRGLQIAQSADESPVARMNAMLIVADLNSKEYARGGGGAATPLPAALPVMLKEFSDPAQIDAVKVACLQGLLRHAEAGISDRGQWNEVQSEMLKTAVQKSPPKNRSEGGQDWIRRRAMDVLAALGLPNDANQADAQAQAIAAIVGDDSERLTVRCQAADTLGMLKLNLAKKLDLAQLANAAGLLAVDASKKIDGRRALRHYTAAIDACFSGPAPPPPRPGVDPPPPPVTGILKAASGTPNEAFIQQTYAEIKKLIDLGTDMVIPDDPVADDLAISEEAVTRGENLASWLEENPPPGEAVAAR
jgi:hypothetical protein